LCSYSPSCKFYSIFPADCSINCWGCWYIKQF